MYWKTETKVGLFTLVALVAFLGLFLFLSHISLFSPAEMKIVGRFSTVTGLKVGNSVRYAGVPVGTVKTITVGPEGVLVGMDIDKSQNIPVDSVVSLQTDGLLGEKFVSIMPGHGTTYLKNGDTVKGDGLSEMDATVNQMNRVLTEAEKLLGSMNQLAGDPQTQAAFRGTLHNTDQITANLAGLTGQMNTLVAQNQANLTDIAHNMAQVSENLNRITTQLNKSVHTIDGDGQSSENVRHILQNLDESSASLRVIASSLQGVVEDKQTLDDIKTTLHNTAQITSAISAVTGGSGGAGVKATASGEMLYNPKAKHYTANVDMALTMNDTYLGVGAHHLGDGTRYDMQYGKILGNQWVLKGGLFDSKPGLGFDWGLPSDRYRFQVAAFNPNDWQYRFRLGARLTRQFGIVGEWNRPMQAPFGGDYYGVQYFF